MKPFDLLSHAVRAKEIFTVLARHGFADLLDQIDLPPGFWRRLVPHPKVSRSTSERIRLAFEELGPAWVKFGQLLSMRAESLPHELILELRKLQNAVKPVGFEAIRKIMQEELEDDPKEVFSSFDETPIAAGSLAQVYFATLREGNRPVAVKIQRPKIEGIIAADLDLAAWLAGQLHQRVDSLQAYDLPAVIEEVRQGVERELDFRNEARNQQYFNAINPDKEHVFAPEVDLKYCTERLLVMDRVIGEPVGRSGLDEAARRQIAARGAESLIHQVLIQGFFHGDPHAGNVLVTPDGRLCFLDWGLAGHLTKRLRYGLADFWMAAVNQEAERVVAIAAELAPVGARVDLRAMERDVTLTLRSELNFSIGRQNLGRAMFKLLYIFGQYGVHLSRDYTLMAKAVLAIEEVGRELDPDFDLRQHARPVLKELYRERTGPRATLRRGQDMLRSSLAALQDLPGEIHRLVRRLEHDDITINLQHKGLDDLDDALKTSANRITLGVIIGSLIIGSSLIVTTGIQPHLFGYPSLGIVGFLLSAILGLYVVWDIFRNRGHK